MTRQGITYRYILNASGIIRWRGNIGAFCVGSAPTSWSFYREMARDSEGRVICRFLCRIGRSREYSSGIRVRTTFYIAFVILGRDSRATLLRRRTRTRLTASFSMPVEIRLYAEATLTILALIGYD